MGGTTPSTPARIAAYLGEMAEICKAATISRRVASLSKAHRAIGADDPCKAEIVKATMRGVKRLIGTAQRQAQPVLREDLFTMLEHMGDRPKDLRDKALLLLGFAGAFRRSELVSLNVADTEHVRQGAVVTLRRSRPTRRARAAKSRSPSVERAGAL